MPRHTMDYSKTIIYKIVCNDLNITETYVGHTTSFVRRKHQHKHTCNKENRKGYNFKIYQTIRDNGGWDNWSMIQICEYPCNSFHEAIAEERRHYELLNAKMNMKNPCRTYEEWYQDNKDIISEKVKIYYNENKDTISEKQKIYNEKNKEQILERHKEYREKNRNLLSEKQKIYVEKNKQIVSEKRREYREKNKEKIKLKYTCCCGSISVITHKTRHEKSKKHIEFIQNVNV
jgi:hypothetical protein